VLPEAGGQGVGRQLLKELERLAREQGLTELHLDSSLTAEPFYRAHGSVREAEEKYTLRSGRKVPAIKGSLYRARLYRWPGIRAPGLPGFCLEIQELRLLHRC
jgi:GNAT superfamily N-acetyltransferase